MHEPQDQASLGKLAGKDTFNADKPASLGLTGHGLFYKVGA